MIRKKNSYNYDYWLNNISKNTTCQYVDTEGNKCIVIDNMSDALCCIKNSKSCYKDFLNNDSCGAKSVTYNKNTNYYEKIDSSKYLKYKYTQTYGNALSESSESENGNDYCEQYSNMPHSNTSEYQDKELPIKYDGKSNTLIIGGPDNTVNMLVYGKIRYTL